MKITGKPKTKIVICAALALSGLLAVAGGSYAAYTSQDSQRAVVKNTDSEMIRFTSNYLQSCAAGSDETNYSGRTVYYSDDQKDSNELSIDIYVYNYANGNTSLVSQKDITYDMTITLSGGDGTGYEVYADGTKDAGNEKREYKFTKTLIGRSAASNHYVVKFPGSDLDKLRITAVARPQNLSVTNNQMLATVIAPCTGTSTQQFKATGKFVDGSDTSNPKDYRGFNYEVSITNGKANATISWNASAVEIDKFFLAKVNKTENDIAHSGGTGGTDSLTFEMNQAEGTGDYLIPFYIKDMSKIPDATNSKKMNELITFDAKQIQ